MVQQQISPAFLKTFLTAAEICTRRPNFEVAFGFFLIREEEIHHIPDIGLLHGSSLLQQLLCCFGYFESARQGWECSDFFAH